MQVPEKLSLIGGSILLASTLVFTLKSQASHILPRISSETSAVFQGDNGKQADQQKKNDQAFNGRYQQAQQKHWQTGQWGTSKYYIDNGMNLHVGSGQLQGALEDTLGHDKLAQIKTINLDGPAQAPQDSQNLFGLVKGDGFNTTTSQINGLDNLDTSHVTNMTAMFDYDKALTNLDVSHFDTSQVTDMEDMFSDDIALTNLNLSHFNTSNVTSMLNMFEYDINLTSLNVKDFDLSNNTSVSNMFDGDSKLAKLDLSGWNLSNIENSTHYEGHIFNNALLNQLTLGKNTTLNDTQGWSGTYRNGNQVLNTNQLADGKVHPGTWIKQ